LEGFGRQYKLGKFISSPKASKDGRMREEGQKVYNVHPQGGFSKRPSCMT